MISIILTTSRTHDEIQRTNNSVYFDGAKLVPSVFISHQYNIEVANFKDIRFESVVYFEKERLQHKVTQQEKTSNKNVSNKRI